MLKQKYESRASLHAQMSAILAGARRANRNLTAEESSKFDRMDEDMVAITEEIRRLESHEAHGRNMNAMQPVALENINGDPRGRTAKMQTTDPYTKVFGKYLRVGLGGMDPGEQALIRTGFDAQAALSPATGSTGGFVVPQGFEDNLDTAKKWFGGIDQFCDVLSTDTGAPLPWPTANDTTNTGEIVGPNTQVTQAQPTFGAVMFNSYKFSSKLVLVPVELLQDAAFDFDQWIPQQLGTRLARIQNTKFTVGSGTSEPTGVVTAVAASGNVVQLAAGNTATVPVSAFYSLESAVDPAYRKGAKYMLSDATLTLVKKLTDTTGRPLWQPGLSATFADGAPDRINGYEYVINNDMPNPGASNYIMAFGAYKEFKVRRVKGYMVLRLVERFADFGQVGFLCFERADSNLVDAGTHPIALLQNSAS